MIEKITSAECEEITSHFRDQLIYYEDIKPWKLHIRKMIWTHLQQTVMITDIKEQTDRFFGPRGYTKIAYTLLLNNFPEGDSRRNHS